MAHQRQPSNAPGGTHAISLKVLRLSKPSLASQTPLPCTSFGNGLDIASEASLAYPGADSASTFPLTPLLTLPPAFGAAYVGETFSCTLCANNEVHEGEGRSVSAVRINVELQTPSNQEGITLELANAAEENDELGEIQPGATLQRIVKHELKEEGPHVLAATVTYTETTHTEDGGAAGGRARTFRKLYQFSAQQLIAVRSKVTERKRREKDGLRQWILEAQLENVGETSVVLEKLWLNERDGIDSTSLNGDESRDATALKPQDVEQVMFVLREAELSEELSARVPLAQLNIDWRSALGEKGSLTTGWLASRGR
jgi:trafficking protein particle complex subunit 13